MKIFGIGLNKTGTTTLGLCGKILGYRCKSHDRGLLQDVVLKNDFSRVDKELQLYDLFEDWPWPLLFEKLDQEFPGSKFILTVRKNENVWLNSLKSHSLRTNPHEHSRKLVYDYNYPHGHERAHLEYYRNHNDNVRSYFSGREDQFLEVCWENGHGWPELCDFLGKKIPDVEFPHANKGVSRSVFRKRYVINRVKSFLRL